VATPVGPADRDPDDPDLWDFGETEEELEEPSAVRYPARAIVAAVLILMLVVLVAASLL
jgi:hypothetical protein